MATGAEPEGGGGELRGEREMIGTGGRDAAGTRRQGCLRHVAHASSVRVRGASLLPFAVGGTFRLVGARIGQ